MLSPRLTMVAKQVSIGATVADIGADHGLIPLYLAKNRIASKVIATDISEASLQKTRNLIRDANLEDIVDVRLGSGLQVIEPGEVDTIIMAGIGGVLIGEILEEGIQVLESVSRLILQPMSAQGCLREWLVKNDFTFAHEVLVKDNRYIYDIIVAEAGEQKVRDPIQYEIGFKLIENRDPLFIEFINEKIAKARTIIKKLESENTENAKEAMGEFRKKLEKYEEAYRWFVQ